MNEPLIFSGLSTKRSIARRSRIVVVMSMCATILVVGAGSLAANAQSPFATAVGDPEQGKAIAAAKCAACHDADGNSRDPKYPKLAGQNPAYLYSQLRAFKSGARRSDIMSAIVATLTDAEAANTASYYGEQAIHPDRIKFRILASVGERIFFGGTGPGMVPACAMCHGAAGQRGMPMMGMMGMIWSGAMATVPNVSDQHAMYVFDQLGRFASGERRGTMMNGIAAALSETDRMAVAQYLAGRP
jgi:cytochrome c553